MFIVGFMHESCKSFGGDDREARSCRSSVLRHQLVESNSASLLTIVSIFAERQRHEVHLSAL